MNHTVNLAIAVNALVVDDYGDVVREIIFPLTLLAVHVPDRLYTALRCAPLRLAGYLAGWRQDLGLIWQAARLPLGGAA
jgi:hypothetical protein